VEISDKYVIKTIQQVSQLLLIRTFWYHVFILGVRNTYMAKKGRLKVLGIAALIVVGIAVFLISYGLFLLIEDVRSSYDTILLISNENVDVSSEEVSVLHFVIPDEFSYSNIILLLRVDLYSIKTPQASIKPIVFMTLINSRNMEILNEKGVIEEAYLVVKGLEENKTFIIENPSDKELYLLLSTPLPFNIKADVSLALLREKSPQIEPGGFLLIGVGGIFALVGVMLKKGSKYVKKLAV